MGLGSGIGDPGSGKKPIPDPGLGVKRAPDPRSGSATLRIQEIWYGFGSADPYLLLMVPDPVIFVSDLQDVNREFFYRLFAS
jgi:hypothetical protein